MDSWSRAGPRASRGLHAACTRTAAFRTRPSARCRRAWGRQKQASSTSLQPLFLWWGQTYDMSAISETRIYFWINILAIEINNRTCKNYLQHYKNYGNLLCRFGCQKVLRGKSLRVGAGLTQGAQRRLEYAVACVARHPLPPSRPTLAPHGIYVFKRRIFRFRRQVILVECMLGRMCDELIWC